MVGSFGDMLVTENFGDEGTSDKSSSNSCYGGEGGAGATGSNLRTT